MDGLPLFLILLLMHLQGLLELLNARLEVRNVLLRHKGVLHLLQIFLRELQLVKQILHFLPLFLQLLVHSDILVLKIHNLLINLLFLWHLRASRL